MAKQLKIKYNDNGIESEYTLEYTRQTISQMEKAGFDANEITSKPMSTLPELFAGAFLAHHRFVKQDKIDAIFRSIKNKPKFLEALAEMFNEPIEALMAEPDEGDEGNADWVASW